MLEWQESFGGTWRTHRYRRIRSDSDLYTFGYRFKPWTGACSSTPSSLSVVKNPPQRVSRSRVADRRLGRDLS